MPYMVTFTINIPPMLAYIPYMDPMGYNTDIDGNFMRLKSKGHLVPTPKLPKFFDR